LTARAEDVRSSWVRYHHQIPANEQDFERFCLRVLQREWACPTLELYGKRGQKQHGVDIIDVSGARPRRAAQCKHKEVGKSIGWPEIVTEIGKAKTFPKKLDVYVIVTTSGRNTQIQNGIIRINEQHSKKTLFSVQVHDWEWIEGILERNPDLVNELYPQQPGSVSLDSFADEVRQQLSGILAAIPKETPPPAGNTHDSYDEDLDTAKSLINQSKHESARVLLERLRRVSWDYLSAHQKFRLITNLAATHMAGEDKELVASLLLEGASHEPGTEKSQTNRAIALELRGDREAACESAKVAFANYPESGSALATVIRNLPDQQLAEIAQMIPDQLSQQPDVSFAMASRALHAGALEAALQWARTCLQAGASNRFQATIILARAAIGAATQALRFRDNEPVTDRPAVLREAIGLLTEVVESANALGSVKVDALLCRAQAHDLLGQASQRDEDVRRAEQLGPASPNVLVAVYDAKMSAEEWSAAIALARRARSVIDEAHATFLLARAMWARNESTDRLEAAEMFGTVASDDSYALRLDAVEHAVRSFGQLNRHADAWKLLDELSSRSDPRVIAVFRAALAASTGDRERATLEVDALLAAEASSLPPNYSRRLAGVLVWLGRDRDALPLLEAIQVPGAVTNDTYDLMNCALRLGRDDVVMERAKELRTANVRDRQILHNEIALLERYAPLEAIELLQSLVSENPADHERVLQLSLLAIRLERPDLVVSDSARLPRPESASPPIAAAVVEVLRRASESSRALAYAYESLRLHFDDPAAHRTYITACLWRDPVDPAPAVDEVQVNTAVCFEDEATDRTQWLIIEDRHDAKPTLDETSAASSQARALLGAKREGRVTVSKGSAQDRVLRVVDIIDKYVYRFQDCMDQFQLRFPDDHSLEMIRMRRKGADADSSELDLEPIQRMLERRRDSAAKIDSLYREHAIPVHVHASASNSSYIESFTHVLQSEDLEIRCDRGRPEEWDQALAAVDAAREVVLDVSAVLAIGLFDLQQLVSDWPIDLLVPHGVFDLIRTWCDDRRRSGPRRALSSPEAGKLVASEETEDEYRDRLHRLEELEEFLSRCCKILDCPQLARLDPDRRKELVTYFGEPSVQALALASAEGRALWTDEWLLGFVGRRDFSVRQAWTQVILFSQRVSGRLTSTEYSSRVARLLGLRYAVTRYDAGVISAAGSIAKWNPGLYPLKQILDQMIGDGPRFQDSIRAALQAIVRIHVDAAIPESRSTVTLAILERIGEKPNGVAAVEAIKAALGSAFGLNILGAAAAMSVVRAWLTARGSPSDGPPGIVSA
jgi:tetratricopeptide (TPR) repeat protein